DRKRRCPMARIRSRVRAGFTLVELLVVMAIMGVLTGLLVPAIQMARERAALLRCEHNLKQIGAAMHNFEVANRKLPPGLGYMGSAYGIAFFHLLPYLETGTLYNSARDASNPDIFCAGYNKVDASVVPVFVCPSDATAASGLVEPWNQVAKSYGAGSYAANAQVLCQVTGDGVLISPQRYAVMPRDFPDGTSNTILIAEKYAKCSNAVYVGGSLWAYD